MAKPDAITNWTAYVARLEQELRNGIDSTSFRHAQITNAATGVTTTFRSFADIRAELNWARTEMLKESMQSAGSSPFIAEVAP